MLGLSAGSGSRFLGAAPTSAAALCALIVLLTAAALSVTAPRGFWVRRIGNDALALVTMSAALLLDQPLAALVIAIVYAGGAVLWALAQARAERDLRAVASRQPRFARKVTGDSHEPVPLAGVAVGDELVVHAGEVLPVDGVLLDASASLDESAVSGDPLVQRRGEGEALRSGTVNAGDALRMRATAVAATSTYAAIVRLAAEAGTARCRLVRRAERLALLLVPAALILAALAWLASGDPLRALAVLASATLFPLVVAAPVALLAGLSCAARRGILMKGGTALEALSQVRTAVFERTGTLTRGGSHLVEIDTAPGFERDKVLRLLASLEQGSSHVLAEAVIRAARHDGLALSEPAGVQTGAAGLEGTVEGLRIRAGTQAFVLGGEPLPLWAVRGDIRFRRQPVLRLFVSIDGHPAGVLTLSDPLHGDATAVVAGLRSAAIDRVVMVTGEDERTAAPTAAALSIDAVVADASPADKAAAVTAEKARAPVMAVGDSGQALAAATVGIARGASGARASWEAAGVVLLADRLMPVLEAVLVARRTRRIALQSLVAGLALSGAMMVAASLGLVSPVAAALLHEAIDVAVVLNALRALGELRQS